MIRPMALICPKCLSDMSEVEHQGVTVDVCQGCRGIWLDAGELAELRGAEEDLPVNPDTIEAGDRYLQATTYICPRCEGSFETFEYAPGSDLYIDRCTNCKGIFLDHGELQKIRALSAPARRTLSLEQETEQQRRLRQMMRRMRQQEKLAEDRPPLPEGQRSFRRSGGGVYLFQLLTGLPVEVENPRRRFPWVTLVLLMANVLVFLLQLGMLSLSSREMLRWAFLPGDFLAGRHLETLFTSMFMHGGFLHLAGNMYFLWLFGDNVEDRLPRGVYLAFYLACGLAASLVHALLTSQPYIPTVGASGAISGIMGAYLVLHPRRKMYQVIWFVQFKVSVAFYLLFWLGLQIVMSAAGLGGVAWFAHIGGFVVGAAGMWLLRRANLVTPDPLEAAA
ncbi:MAG: hypothetical protein DRI34_05985 [Deltaproteobacteria bacterium]|nr:MAG: hypothetical protein DRI34_05985 [Deltaproteobacteria bacterium]